MTPIREVGSSTARVAYEKASVTELRLIISDLEYQISLASGRGGALHIR